MNPALWIVPKYFLITDVTTHLASALLKEVTAPIKRVQDRPAALALNAALDTVLDSATSLEYMRVWITKKEGGALKKS